ncbi:hypothetical protein DN069_02760 [Streptacidiphilus pinicola]|uniref:Uncharacterized protein n=1 Tax=Streptacidiphilus pinicola TaxID=2219663 RepID=A0A2X0IPL4_9ACTN|nr:hypothetical protein DN069_02760 [Streptacidiphilus pinicola]
MIGEADSLISDDDVVVFVDAVRDQVIALGIKPAGGGERGGEWASEPGRCWWRRDIGMRCGGTRCWSTG